MEALLVKSTVDIIDSVTKKPIKTKVVDYSAEFPKRTGDNEMARVITDSTEITVDLSGMTGINYISIEAVYDKEASSEFAGLPAPFEYLIGIGAGLSPWIQAERFQQLGKTTLNVLKVRKVPTINEPILIKISTGAEA